MFIILGLAGERKVKSFACIKYYQRFVTIGFPDALRFFSPTCSLIGANTNLCLSDSYLFNGYIYLQSIGKGIEG